MSRRAATKRTTITQRSTTTKSRYVTGFVCVAIVACFVVAVFPQGDVTDVDLERSGGGRTLAIGALATDKHVTRMPLETYVARVLAGEAEPNAPDGELEALAIAVRTFAIFNAGRHGRDGFDLCDTTHCQVPRASTAATRRAALATAGQILTWQGAPAEIFYSASCGGRSESAANVWPGANLPYLKAVKDDVHGEDEPWMFEVTLQDAQRALAQRGFAGSRLKDVKVATRNSSGRVATLKLSGLEPDVIAGDQFRAIISTRELKSTAFKVDKRGDRLRFTGQGYGHGVGMCVIGAGRRARRGEDVRHILAQYYPGLQVTPLDAVPARIKPETTIVAAPPARSEAAAPAPRRAEGGPAAPPAIARSSAVIVRGTTTAVPDLPQLAARVHDALAKELGASVAPLTIEVHESVESFRAATGKPWWVSSAVNGTAIDLAPPGLLQQREGIEAAVRAAIATAIVAPSLAGRPEWVRVGAARYFSRGTPPQPPDPKSKLKCPADAELTLAISAVAQREAESRAEACFARAYALTKDWRSVR